MQELVDRICQEHGLVIQERFTLGNICEGVYRVIDKTGAVLVLKIGNTQRSIAEIVKNSIGYKRLQEEGLGWFIPKIILLEIKNEFAVILMEYCGEDFLTQIKKSNNPIQLYNNLIIELEKVYHQSRQKSEKGNKMVLSVIDKINEQYKKYIYGRLDNGKLLGSKLQRIDAFIDEINSIKFCCFSNWDFTPDDVYLTPAGLKYSDPHEEVLGIPIIDMACFAGVVKAHHLPEANKGYKIIEKFATDKIPAILSIPQKSAYKLFCLGRLLQCFLSIRFRIDTKPRQAKSLFVEAQRCLEKII